MKLRNTLLLLLIAGALFAFIRFYESHQATTQEAQERAGKIVTLDREKVDAISIKNPDAKIELRKDAEGIWRVEEPVKDRADSTLINQLFTAVESLRSDARIGDEKSGPDKEQLKEIGLANPEIKLHLVSKERTAGLLFGKDAAVEGKVYVKTEDSPSAFVIGKDLKDQISKKADDFRDRKLTDLSPGQVNRVALKTAAGEIELQKKDQHWFVTKPLSARGDDSKINDLISQAATARIDSFVGDQGNLASYGLQEPRGSVSLFVEGVEKPAVLQLGGNPKDEKDKEKTYASLSTRDSVVLLPKSIETLLETKPNDLRDRNFVRVEADIVDRVGIEGKSGAKILLARSGESWVRKDGSKDVAINVNAARRVLDELRSQQIASFVADVATDLAPYGLSEPQVILTLSSYASENTAETKAGEKPIVTIHFGKVENGVVYAKIAEEPFVVTVPQAVLEPLLLDPVQWQPLEIYNEQAEEITSLELVREGQPALSFDREKGKPWKLAKGDGAVNQTNIESLVNTLATLRAVRWIGARSPEHGLEKPGTKVAFKTAKGTSGSLSFGVSSPDDLTFAAAAENNGTFAVSRPDFTAFQLPLIEKGEPTAAAPAEPGTGLPASSSAATGAATPKPSTPVPSQP
ncbi:MAG TPA: DUF4340 domain-containing protein [Chthoniobacteraceae bacterium]|jgi:hypothetical protein